MNIQLDYEVKIDILARLKYGNGGKQKIGYLTGEIVDDEIVIEGVHVPEQESSEVGAVVTSDQQHDALEHIVKSGKEIVGIVKYCADMAMFESAVTKLYRERIAEEGFSDLLMIINSKGEYNYYQ